MKQNIKIAAISALVYVVLSNLTLLFWAAWLGMVIYSLLRIKPIWAKDPEKDDPPIMFGYIFFGLFCFVIPISDALDKYRGKLPKLAFRSPVIVKKNESEE